MGLLIPSDPSMTCLYLDFTDVNDNNVLSLTQYTDTNAVEAPATPPQFSDTNVS